MTCQAFLDYLQEGSGLCMSREPERYASFVCCGTRLTSLFPAYLDEDFEEEEDSDNSVVSIKVGPPSGTKSKILKVPKPSKKKRKAKASTAPPPEATRSESPEPVIPTETLWLKGKGYVSSFHLDEKQYILVNGIDQPVSPLSLFFFLFPLPFRVA